MALGLLLSSCSFLPPAPSETAPGEENELLPSYIVVCIIHGDSGYLFHDPDGNEYRADEEALAGAKKVAERNSQAEVFIFHEKRRRHFMLFFPRRDGEFYYYRNGRLLAQESYWRDHGQSRFDPEVELYYRFRAEERPRPVRLFLYFGHEIPEIGGTGYDASYRDRTFTVHELVDGLKRLTRNSTKFDLIMLSSCFNGTPHTISALTPYARYIIASPGNLHLSYFDLHPFEALDVGLRDGDVSAFAKECAHQSFDRLTKDIQTEITVAVYDVDRVQGFLYSVDSVYDDALTRLKEEAPTSIEHCDCAEDPAYVRPEMSEGIDVFYRPARFGRSRHKQEHSGWECPKLLK
ncbi:MAG TPA: clostripain-related cysteine peptidase [Candidatus Deferrimicrobium sp.]|nr:clostripain-related cysteine peptidase [Candidatus Deferrimicrobium sp.]